MNGWVGLSILAAVFLGACVAGVGDPGAPEAEIQPAAYVGLPVVDLAPAVRAPVAVVVTTSSSTTSTTAPAPAHADGWCHEWEPLLIAYAPPGGWDIAKMSRTMWRESNCRPEVQSRTSDSGLLQVNRINHTYLRGVLGEWVDKWTLTDPVQNVRAAAALCTYWRTHGGGCYTAWRGGA